MSLPSPTTGGAAFPTLSRAEQEKMDAPLIALATQSGGDLRKLLFMFFSFLHRRTDFYVIPNEEDVQENVPTRMGFKEGDAERMLLAAFRQFPLRKMPRQGGAGVRSSEGAAAVSPKSAKIMAGEKPKVAAASTAKSGKAEEKVLSELSSAAEKGTSTVGSDGATDAKGDRSSMSKEDALSDRMGEVRLTEEGKQIPVGNGGRCESYQWTQTIDEVTVIVGVPEGTKGKDLAVSLKPSSVSVRMKRPAKDGEEPPTIVEGSLTEKIRTDESTWSLEGGVLLLQLDKVKKMWWETVLEGDAKIDTSLVDSTRKIGEYDEATQGAIRKILFDQKQERMGAPTSDEILREKAKIPPLPPGVEYIDKSTFPNSSNSRDES